jgi:hypothetical protein
MANFQNFLFLSDVFTYLIHYFKILNCLKRCWIFGLKFKLTVRNAFSSSPDRSLPGQIVLSYTLKVRRTPRYQLIKTDLITICRSDKTQTAMLTTARTRDVSSDFQHNHNHHQQPISKAQKLASILVSLGYEHQSAAPPIQSAASKSFASTASSSKYISKRSQPSSAAIAATTTSSTTSTSNINLNNGPKLAEILEWAFAVESTRPFLDWLIEAFGDPNLPNPRRGGLVYQRLQKRNKAKAIRNISSSLNQARGRGRNVSDFIAADDGVKFDEDLQFSWVWDADGAEGYKEDDLQSDDGEEDFMRGFDVLSELELQA